MMAILTFSFSLSITQADHAFGKVEQAESKNLSHTLQESSHAVLWKADVNSRGLNRIVNDLGPGRFA